MLTQEGEMDNSHSGGRDSVTEKDLGVLAGKVKGGRDPMQLCSLMC